MEKPWLEYVDKLKEIRYLVRDLVEIIKDMQVNCQALHLASHGYE